MERTNRKKFICQGVSKTDQSYKKSTDINILISKYKKTGIIPNLNQRQGRYGDFSSSVTLEEAFETTQNAIEAFNELPANIRKAMDNDPSKLEIWLSDEENYDMAVKYGLKKAKEPTDVVLDGNSQDNNSNITGDNNASASN
jgi:phage internal scaffolding protein